MIIMECLHVCIVHVVSLWHGSVTGMQYGEWFMMELGVLFHGMFQVYTAAYDFYRCIMYVFCSTGAVGDIHCLFSTFIHHARIHVQQVGLLPQLVTALPFGMT